jgi:hypothetical protein
MIFNPPPNWPQPPAGWTPPPDWEPDPSWPRLPYGWPLWVEEDEFVISPYRAAATQVWPTQSTQPWYRRTVYIVLLLIFFFPVGLALLWLRPDWSVQRRSIITAVVGVLVIIALPSVDQSPATTTTALSPTASPSPSASRSATPSPAAPAPVVVKTTPAPVTSTPPKTTAPAPVRTSAAPVYSPPAPAPTTQAPQPVQTTAQQQSCTPLTDSGKCYTPGEYCRDDDHNMSGIDADGNPITCEDNDGWRWEPA